ncbi:MAG: hypothetical protein WBB07_04200 [Mycobacterium sp.]
MVDTVLGVSVTPTSVRSVLVEGRYADGATLEHNEYDAFEEVGAALARTRDGRAVASIGVTWSDDAELETSQVLDGMARAGLTDVSAIPLSAAVEALASSIGQVTGYNRTALCAVEPGTAALVVVDDADDSVDVMISHALDSDDKLVDWLVAALAADMRPDGLFVVGSLPGLGRAVARLETELGLPAFHPPEAELALAHGAALAAAGSTDLRPFEFDAVPTRKTRRKPVTAPLTLLVAGAVTFVVSLSIAVGDGLAPTTNPAPSETRNMVRIVSTPPMARPAPPPAAPVAPPPAVVPIVVEEALPPAPPVEAAPPPPAPEFVPEAPAPEYVPVEVPAAPPAMVAPPPPIYQAPAPKPGLWERFKEKLKPGPPGAPIPPG